MIVISRRFMDCRKVGRGCRKAVMNQINLADLHGHEQDQGSIERREAMRRFYASIYNHQKDMAA